MINVMVFVLIFYFSYSIAIGRLLIVYHSLGIDLCGNSVSFIGSLWFLEMII